MSINSAVTILLLAAFVCFNNGCTNKQVSLTVLGENSSNLQAIEALKRTYENETKIKIDFKPNTFGDAVSAPFIELGISWI